MEKYGKKANWQNGENMKKLIKIIVIIGVIFVGLSIKAFASENDTEYIISQTEDAYILSDGVNRVEYQSLEQCLSSIDHSSQIKMLNVASSESITLPKGDFVISGSFSSDGIISISSGTNVTMQDLNLNLGEKGYVRIKGGTLSVVSSEIAGKDLLIKLDYSSSSNFAMVSGLISGMSENPIIDIENGLATISGGVIENSAGAVIKNDGELILSQSPRISGVAYDIILESQMSLSLDGNEYTSSEMLSIQYMDSFDMGTLTEIFYECTERSISKIRLYDKYGKEEDITYFDSCNHVDEKNFAGVYLPYTVKFYVNEIVVAEQKILSGEKAIFVAPPEVLGYTFDCWYEDRSAERPYSFDNIVNSSFSLYGYYNLLPPTFNISSKEFTYDGEEHILKFDQLEHVLSGGYYTYQWYKDGHEISTLNEVSVKNVSDSGIYSCRVVYTINGKTASFYTDNIQIKIKKAIVNLPSIPSLKYTGNLIYPNIPNSQYYVYSCDGGTDVGSYPVTFSLNDPSNTKWSDSNEASITQYFEITKATNQWIEEPSAQNSYVGFPLQSYGSAIFGKVVFLYSVTEDGNYTTECPTSVGRYYMKAAVSESTNYTAIISHPISFNILQEQVVGICLIKAPNKTEYFSFEKLDLFGIEVSAIYNSGRQEIVESSCLQVVYNKQNTLRAGDQSVVIEYMGASLILPVTVELLDYDISNLPLSNMQVVYNGCYQSYSIGQSTIFGLDGIPLNIEVSGGGINAGDYPIVVRFSSESSDYNIPSDINITLSILPCNVDIDWGITEFTYDSTPKAPSATLIDVNGVLRKINVSGSAIFAGSGYTAIADQYSSNYVYNNPTVFFNINKADYNTSGINWSFSSCVYTGEVIEVVIENLPDGVTVVGYTDNRAVNVGEYTATASFNYDEKNYNPPVVDSFCWQITPAEYDISSFEFISTEYEYDGDEHFPTLIGTLPIGMDGVALEYSFSTGAKNVSDGEVTVSITFASESKNYIIPEPQFARVRITPKGIYVIWTADSFIYDGNEHIPGAECVETDLIITGYGIEHGTYVATAEAKNTNYTVLNSTHPYEIKKTTNYWITPPTISDFYESRSPSPRGTPYFGKVIYKYYSDETLSVEVDPSCPGEYYMLAIVPESKNYLELVSNPIAVICMEVMPIGITAEISGQLVAFSTLENSILVHIMYNDGSQIVIPYCDIEIEYENGDSLRAADTKCLISYGEFYDILDISVSKATYDISSVYWDITEVEYDGTPHAPILCGLPEGISVISYSHLPVVTVGEYSFMAELNFDAENYYPPNISGCTFQVKKAILPNVENITLEYSGQVILPEDADLYYGVINDEIKECGEYSVIYHLTDNNYVFENGSDTCFSTITVTPRKLNVYVSDFDLYMFEKSIDANYVVEGLISDIDAPEFYYFIENDKIYIKTDNPNYLLNVECGTLRRIPYPTETVKKKIMTIVITVIMVLSATILLVWKKDYILDGICMIIAKRKNKVGIGYIDNAPPAIQKSSNCQAELDSKDVNLLLDENKKENVSEGVTDDIEDTDSSLSDMYQDDVLEKSEFNESGEPKISIKLEYANSMITDAMARQMIKNEREVIYTDGGSKSIVNVDTLSRNFIAEDRVDVNILKDKSLVPYDTNYVKVLARGAIDKPLHIYANEFSLAAVKMILLSGGEARRVTSLKKEKNKPNK